MDRLIARCRTGRVRVILLLMFVLVVLLACFSSPGIILSTAAPVLASALKLSINIEGQYASVTTGETSVFVYVIFSDASGGFVLSGKQTMTCNGVMLASKGANVPLQPPGGEYTFIYTDEQGRQTALIVPVPQGTFAVTDPASGAVVPIPKSARTPPPTPVSSARPPEYTGTMHIHYRFPVAPQNAAATLTAEVWSQSVGIVGEEEQETGDYTVSDASTSYGQGFDAFVPGPGSIALDSKIQWTAPPGGFQAVSIEYTDALDIPITWAIR